ncbi:MAG: type IV toxin-antitoxin system AbiEi family antitoxin domain-containing protein [Oscillospiraceae bacterium]|nr:MAG: type IV toxin-antitoxin system AbiEi family antitoxin domain-containing protein [Oscillospiraceae bacterium]
MEKTTNLKLIRDRINRSDIGTVYVAVDFVDISDKTSVNAYLARLVDEGLIRRVLRGVYDKPEYNDFLEEYVAPSPDKVANAIARNFGWTIVPCGDTALNLLGLSTQVPAAWVYVSDGTYKEYTYDNTTIQFKRTTNKEVSKLSYKTALTVQAFKALGKDKIDDMVISRLGKLLTAEEKQTMLEEAKAATSWIYEYIKQVCRS